jgi:hypothetical protein
VKSNDKIHLTSTTNLALKTLDGLEITLHTLFGDVKGKITEIKVKYLSLLHNIGEA